MQRITKLFLWMMKARYTISVKHFPKLDPEYNYFILPNHIAYLDPVLLWAMFYPERKLRPVATSRFAENFFLRWLFRWIGTISIVEMAREKKGLAPREEKLNSAMEALQEALAQGDSVLLYPSGQLAGQGFESLWGKRAAYQTVQGLGKKTRVLLVRTRGLWGSIWSNAWTGETPSLVGGIVKGLFYLLANGFVFSPRRKVELEFCDMTEKVKQASKEGLEVFNQTLEAFYNEKGEEKVKYLPHFFYYNDVEGKVLPAHVRNSIEDLQAVNGYEGFEFAEEVVATVCAELRRIRELPQQAEITLESNLILDLYLDSLDMAEIKNFILTRYAGASNTPLLELKTVADLVAMAMGKTANEKSDFPPCEWELENKEYGEPQKEFDEDMTILELFRKQWKADPNATQSYDVMYGMQKRKDIVLKAFLISDYLKAIPGKQIGIMLPAVGSMNVLLLAVYLAEKVPVMMNWTHPQSAFAHCVKFSKTKKILTSKAFFNKLNIERLKEYEFIFLEDLLKKIPLYRKLKALVKSWVFPLPPQSSEDPAVVLYTSGSEALPKAVPLTHKNLISNLIGALSIMHIKQDERFFCYLPPFHSFGFTVNTVFPLVAGFRSVSTPDPNDSLTVAQLIAHSKPTLLATTPTFLRNLLNVAKSEQLASLRYVITGGEKCSESLFERFRQAVPQGVILEGYGITECSPIIAINPIEKQKAQSVGIAVGNGELCILDINTQEVLKQNQEGMIYYCGPNVFSGYPDQSIESPFWEQDWKVWYRTGDLGYRDKDGYLYITGRKKRFLKLWGEMISLPFLEGLLLEQRGNSEEANLALEGKEHEHGIEITLFVVDLKISLKEVNSYLRAKGVSNLIQVNHIKKIGAIPLLWTGKIDYKVLKGMIDGH